MLKIILALLPMFPYIQFMGSGWAANHKGETRMTKEATPNYTPEQEQAMRAVGTIDNAKALELAEQFGKDVKSVRAKAVRMGIYQAKAKVSKSGGPVESKEQIAADIARLVNANMDGLEKAPKLALQRIRSALAA
jgi:hypothetical protein